MALVRDVKVFRTMIVLTDNVATSTKLWEYDSAVFKNKLRDSNYRLNYHIHHVKQIKC